jgi:hypothetical protein
MIARVLNVMLGVWLFVSAGLWLHDGWQFYNAWICGALMVTFGIAGLQGRAWGRLANIVLGFWLMASSLIVPWQAWATPWNHLLVGVSVVILALLPTGVDETRGRPRGHARA